MPGEQQHPWTVTPVGHQQVVADRPDLLPPGEDGEPRRGAEYRGEVREVAPTEPFLRLGADERQVAVRLEVTGFDEVGEHRRTVLGEHAQPAPPLRPGPQ